MAAGCGWDCPRAGTGCAISVSAGASTGSIIASKKMWSESSALIGSRAVGSALDTTGGAAERDATGACGRTEFWVTAG